MFSGELKYEKIDGESFVGRPQFRLLEDFSYSVWDGVYFGLITVTVPKGFVTDFASIPEWIFFLKPKNGVWKHASVIHDYLCKQKDVPKWVADRVFYHAMRDDGASLLTAWFMWSIVRLNHLLILQG
jgi:hypothetical protein